MEDVAIFRLLMLFIFISSFYSIPLNVFIKSLAEFRGCFMWTGHYSEGFWLVGEEHLNMTRVVVNELFWDFKYQVDLRKLYYF